MGEREQRSRSLIVNRAERIEQVRQTKQLPDGMKELYVGLIIKGDLFVQEIGGSLELAWRRGYHSGYVDGYKDAQKRKPPKWKDVTIL